MLAEKSKDTNLNGKSVAELVDHVLPALTAAMSLLELQAPAEADNFRRTVVVAIEAAVGPSAGPPETAAWQSEQASSTTRPPTPARSPRPPTLPARPARSPRPPTLPARPARQPCLLALPANPACSPCPLAPADARPRASRRDQARAAVPCFSPVGSSSMTSPSTPLTAR
ncbi:hypothetical protein AB0K16_15615 [Nonomuraea jabiensis]|uniref:hypothetical protein n=1 Tax=Nonomuraea jabiensis TaxID=882448 RepID=UPI0034362E8E